MHSNAMGAGKSRRSLPSDKVFRLAHIRKLKECEQAAAVCYRMREGEVEFLLVRTGSAHWTFPKGGVEPGLTHAQSAALEAFEEAGVHGLMEETSFARYVRRKGSGAKNSAKIEVRISAHLCEVRRVGPPQESGRNPTWFSIEDTKRRLAQGRKDDFATEMARVVERAVRRIQRLRHTPDASNDALQKVFFEAGGAGSIPGRVQEVDKEVDLVRSVRALPPPRAMSAGRRTKALGPVLVVEAGGSRKKNLMRGKIGS